MNADHASAKSCFLRIGQVLITQDPQVCITLLGSCIGVTFFDKRTKWAAMCHALRIRHRGAVSNHTTFVEDALQVMIDAFRAKGLLGRNLEARLFGGSSVLGPSHERVLDPGPANSARALEILDQNRIHLRQIEIGGGKGRKLWFDTGSGQTRFEYLGYQRLKYDAPA